MNEVYQRFSPDIEIYSIDESFLDVAQIEPEKREEFARDLRSSVSTWTGIPTCVGIGPTKTLAKLANKIAKSTPQLLGVCDLTSATAREEWLPLVELGDIWGVGPASQAKLMALGCRTAADVASVNGGRIPGHLGGAKPGQRWR
ncbi:DNA polymerase V subunit UmuC, partial [Cupriavidus sp. 2MCAB6]|uniref:Y-family DNA polymerase n=1 Tax=Cupriavidus sp. 2MCAB6 TaxID=3232981 RepID=UPI003F8F2662